MQAACASTNQALHGQMRVSTAADLKEQDRRHDSGSDGWEQGQSC